MEKSPGLRQTIVLSVVLAAMTVFLVVCGNVGTATNTNTSPTADAAKSASGLEPAVISICRTYADKVALLCKGGDNLLTDWHKKALDMPDAFLADCIADDTFKNAEENFLKVLQDDVNNANNCKTLVDIFQ